MNEIVIHRGVECSNSRLYGEGRRVGYHCSNDASVGEKCPFCNGTFRLVQYSVPKDQVKRTVVKVQR